MSFTTKSKISDLKSNVCNKKNQNDNCMKAIKIEENDFNETILTKSSNSYETNKGLKLN